MTTKRPFFENIRSIQPFLRNGRMKRVACGLVVWGAIGAVGYETFKDSIRGIDINAKHNTSDMPIYSLMKPSWSSRILQLSDESAETALQKMYNASYPYFTPATKPLYRDYWRWNGFQITKASDETKDALIQKARHWGIDRMLYDDKEYVKAQSLYSAYDVKSYTDYFFLNNVHDKLRLLLALNEYESIGRQAYQAILNSNTSHAELLMILNERPESVAKLYKQLREYNMTYEIITRGLTASTKMYGYAAAQYQSVDLLRNYGCVTEADRMEKAFRLEEAYVKTERFMSKGISFKEAGAYGNANFEPLPRYTYKKEEWDNGFPQDGDPKYKWGIYRKYQYQFVLTENSINEHYAIPFQNAIVNSISPQCVARLKSY